MHVHALKSTSSGHTGISARREALTPGRSRLEADVTQGAAPAVDDFLELLAMQARIEQALSRRLRREGAGLSEYRVLRLLRQSPEHEMRLLDLTEALGLDQSSVSRLVVR